MIIQCEQCETKFRFDESLISEKGVWVRCSRCRHEFFQHHPEAQPPAEDEMLIPDIHADGYKPIPEALPDIESLTVEKTAEPAEGDGEEKEQAPEKETPRTALTVLYLLIALILLASLGIWVLPDARMKAMQMLSPYVPAIEGRIGADASKKKSGLEGIQIQSVRQRYVNNRIAGGMRVIQGDLINGTDAPMTRIQVKAELADASDAVIAQRQSYAGNLLTDEELAALPDEAIQQKLAYIQGSPVSNDRVTAGGLIPFMIVVAAEPPGVANVYLSIAGAEKLLQ